MGQGSVSAVINLVFLTFCFFPRFMQQDKRILCIMYITERRSYIHILQNILYTVVPLLGTQFDRTLINSSFFILCLRRSFLFTATKNTYKSLLYLGHILRPLLYIEKCGRDGKLTFHFSLFILCIQNAASTPG